MGDLLFSVKPEIDLYSGTGPGGQNRNKSKKCVRLRHKESGVIVTASDSKSLETNKKVALRRLSEHPEFKKWLRIQSAIAIEGYSSLDEKVDAMMSRASDFKVEHIGS